MDSGYSNAPKYCVYTRTTSFVTNTFVLWTLVMHRISCSYDAHEGIRGTGSLTPLNLNFGTIHNGLVSFTSRPLSGVHCTGGWVAPKAGLDGCGKSRFRSGFDPQSFQRVSCRYTDYAVRAYTLHLHFICVYKMLFISDWYQSKIIAPKSCSVDLLFQILSKSNE